jgi:hypothetical protein
VYLALPSIIFLAAMYLLGHVRELEFAWDRLLVIVGQRSDPDIPGRWVGVWDRSSLVGTDYALLSLAQLKYLANAFFLLAPSALPLLGAFAVVARRRFVASAEARFLAVASVPLVLYCFALRPLWGPYDWDLFTLPALYLAFLAAHLTVAHMHEDESAELISWLAGIGLLFVAIPLIWIGITVYESGGPFDHRPMNRRMFEPDTDEYRGLAPWL